MTVCATEVAARNANDGGAPRPGCVITADGTYAARLARAGKSWFPERWTLDGPEPYAVPLPGNQPEEPGTEVLPISDGRVLIHRIAGGRHLFSLLYPTGPGTGELLLGAVECRDPSDRVRLLPPAPRGGYAYALAVGRSSSVVWLVAGGSFGPERLAEVPGRCSGGVWLDGTGRMLALDRSLGGRTKTVVVDLEDGGSVSPLLQIAEDSDDRLLLADPDSGLLLIRSDAPSPGRGRLGWGVLGSTLPVRFPECLRLRDCVVTPFAIQPGQVLTPESCAVALRLDGAVGSWVGVWRPAERQVHHLAAPEGWLAGAGRWSRDGVLQLPYATGVVPCGVTRVEVPGGVRECAPCVSVHVGESADASVPTSTSGDEAPSEPQSLPLPLPELCEPVAARPVPLREAPLRGQVGAQWASSAAGQGFSPPPPLPVPSLGAAPPDPRCRPERPRPQTPDGLGVPDLG
ncbi:hypothetical protein [Streptomyces bluensis]|uniref:Uncharacterized protein n=1 Tax=Streptomyces bluensis TaxID=33897 RepID=A0ABW6UE84_9ACTN